MPHAYPCGGIPSYERLDEQQCYRLLERYAPDEKTLGLVVGHSRRVAEKAVELASEVKGVDVDFMRSAALLHDIGRFRFPPGEPGSIKHGIAGAKILREEGLEMHARVAERHIGIGITAADIREQGLELPEADYVPRTAEELTIAYVDNLDHDGTQDEAFVEERFARELGEAYRQRVRRFHEQVHELLQR